MTARASWLSQIFAAVAFAESGEIDAARQLLSEAADCPRKGRSCPS
ncbi:MAG: hypothetical protein H7840_02850 [Alphaproteobacteria bacterium]